jgi:stage III sporulation protein AD
LSEIIKIVVFAVLGVVILLVLKNHLSSFAIVAEICVAVMIIFAILPYIKEFLTVLDSLNGITNSSGTAIKIMLKAFAVLMVGSVTADICRDNSAGAIAGVVELAVKILAISISLPVFSAVLEVALAIFNG